MKEGVINRDKIVRLFFIDAIIIAVVLFLPIIAHSIGKRFLFLEPMRIALFVSVLVIKERKNNYVLATLLPWISFFVVGMPVGWKAALMSIEMLTNIWLLYWLLDKKTNPGLAVCISMILAKSLYYVMKFLLIKFAILPSSGTVVDFPRQLLSIALFSVLFLLFDRITKRIQ